MNAIHSETNTHNNIYYATGVRKVANEAGMHKLHRLARIAILLLVVIFGGLYGLSLD